MATRTRPSAACSERGSQIGDERRYIFAKVEGAILKFACGERLTRLAADSGSDDDIVGETEVRKDQRTNVVDVSDLMR